jgi:hypothetical protein
VNTRILIAAAVAALTLAGCGASHATEPQPDPSGGRPILVCLEREVAVWTNYPVSYRCVADDAHDQHSGH